MDAYVRIRLEYLEKRRVNQLGELRRQLLMNVSRYVFVKGVVDGSIVLNRKTSDQVEAQLRGVKEITPDEGGSYGYLLSMPMSSVTKERLDKLQETIKGLKDRYDDLKTKTPQQMWLEELEKI